MNTPYDPWAASFGEELHQTGADLDATSLNAPESGAPESSAMSAPAPGLAPAPGADFTLNRVFDLDVDTDVTIIRELDVDIEVADGAAASFANFLNGGGDLSFVGANTSLALPASPTLPDLSGFASVTVNELTDIDVKNDVLLVDRTDIDISVLGGADLGLTNAFNSDASTFVDAANLALPAPSFDLPDFA